MTNKTEKLELKVVKDMAKSHINIKPEEFLDAEEGDRIGPFKLIDKEEIPCDHENVIWSLDNKHSSTAPNVTGRCEGCGARLKAESEEVKVIEKEDSSEEPE